MYKTIFRLALLQLVGLVLAVGIAHADTGAQAAPPQNLAALWPMLGLAIANMTAYGTRKLSAKYTFFHTGAGAIALAFIGSVISSVTPIIQAHGFVWASLAWAAVGAATSFFATLNPSATADEPPAKSPAAAGLRAFLPLLLLPALLAIGCATAQKDTMVAELGLAKTVSLGYRTVDGIDKAKTDAMHNDILAGKAAQVRPELDAYRPKIKKALAGLGAGADLVVAVDTVRQAADKGQRDWKDFTAYLPQLASMVAQIEALIADLKAVAQ